MRYNTLECNELARRLALRVIKVTGEIKNRESHIICWLQDTVLQSSAKALVYILGLLSDRAYLRRVLDGLIRRDVMRVM